jgi:hypothetical protein
MNWVESRGLFEVPARNPSRGRASLRPSLTPCMRRQSQERVRLLFQSTVSIPSTALGPPAEGPNSDGLGCLVNHAQSPGAIKQSLPASSLFCVEKPGLYSASANPGLIAIAALNSRSASKVLESARIAFRVGCGRPRVWGRVRELVSVAPVQRQTIMEPRVLRIALQPESVQIDGRRELAFFKKPVSFVAKIPNFPAANILC